MKFLCLITFLACIALSFSAPTGKEDKLNTPPKFNTGESVKLDVANIGKWIKLCSADANYKFDNMQKFEDDLNHWDGQIKEVLNGRYIVRLSFEKSFDAQPSKVPEVREMSVVMNLPEESILEMI